eukprot:1256406-Rhodomonas_salina.1
MYRGYRVPRVPGSRYRILRKARLLDQESSVTVASPNKPPHGLISGAGFCLFLLGPGSRV